MSELPTMVIELHANNHPGVLSHIMGLFSRRGFNLEALLCAPDREGETSRMYLLVKNDERLDQMVRQLLKLYDVRSAVVRDDVDHTLFTRLEETLR